MVRIYQRKTNGPGRGHSWSQETLCQAVDAVKAGLSGYEAAKTYNIPRKTIMDRVIGRRGKKSSTQGRPTALSAETEKVIADCLHIMERNGFGLTRKEVLELVGDYVKKNNIKTPFANGHPGSDWFSSFMFRYKLSIKKPQAVELARKKAADPFIIQEFYNILEKVVKELGLENKPERIYNIDETSYCSDPQKTKVVGLKGYPSTRTTSSAGKTNTTVLVAGNAAGGKGPPFIIFKGKHVWSSWTSEEAYPGTLYSATSNGWIESNAFEEYLTKSFIPMVKTGEEPTLLIYDGHSTHVQLAVVEKAKQNNITIIKLPPHSSHLLQPLDLSVFKPYKDAWDMEMVKWQRQHKAEKLPKDQFSVIVGRVWEQLDSNVIKKGFEKSGIYPFNRNAVPEHKLDPEALKRWKKHLEESSKEQTVTRGSPLSLIRICLQKINYCSELNSNPDPTFPSAVRSNPSKIISFEDLLIQYITPTQTGKGKRKNVQISANAEVITDQDVIQRLKQKEEDKANKEREKEENRKKREEKKKAMFNKQNEKKNNEKGKKSDVKRKTIRLTKNKKTDVNSIEAISSDVSDSPTPGQYEFRATLSEKILSDSNLNVPDPVHLVKDDSPILCLPSTSAAPLPPKLKPKIDILEDRYLKCEEKLTEDVFTGHKIKRPADLTLKGTDKKISVKKIKLERSNKCTEKKRKQKKSKLKDEEYLEKDSSDYTVHDSDNSDIDLETYYNIYLTDNDLDDQENVGMDFGLADLEYYEETSSKLKIGDWVLVKFATKKSVKHYVGQIIDIQDDIPTVKYLRKIETKKNGLLFVYPNVDDICELKHVADIVSVLPKPTVSRRGQISFSIILREFNIQ